MRAREFIKEAEEQNLNKQLEKHYWNQYNPTDREMIGRYVRDNSYLNGMLYSKDAEKHLRDPANAYHTDAIKRLDTLAHQQTTPADMTVHRGLRDAPQFDKDNIMTSKGFLSTSADPEFVKYWSNLQARGRQEKINRNPKAFAGMTNPDYKHIMQIQVPKGTPGFYASDAQAEWVAPRGSQVKVNPTPTIDPKTKTVNWQGQYRGNTFYDVNPPAGTKATRGLPGGGGIHGVPDDLAMAYNLHNPMMGAEFDYVPNLIRAEREARLRKK